MYCPSCSYLLQKLEVTTNSGGKFSVDHCGRCGGSWFDPYEINRIPYHEVVRIANLTVLPRTSQPTVTIHKCPRCHRQLHFFHSESMPKGIRFWRCSKCHGIWATQIALQEFKKYQQDKIEAYKTSTTAFPSLSVVFIPALFVLLLLMVTFTTILTLQETKEARIKAESNISRLHTRDITPSTITVVFQTKAPLKSSISYGRSTFELSTKIISTSPTTSHIVTLSNLEPKTLYVYKITLEDEAGRRFETGNYSFATY